MTTVLALDLASTVGWALDDLADHGRPVWGTLRLKSDAECYEQKGHQLASWLKQHIATHGKPDLIGYEKPQDFQRNLKPGEKMWRPTNYATLRILYGLPMAAGMFAVHHRIRVVEVPVITWRSHFIGKQPKRDTTKPRDPEESKKLAWNRCQQLGWHVEPKHYDESDACGIWCFLKSTYDKSFAYRAPTRPEAPLPLMGGVDARAGS